MVPVETVFNRFPRMIRDVSRELTRILNCICWEETELDRTVIDEIEIRLYIFSGTLDHGLETHEKEPNRQAHIGNIYLRASMMAIMLLLRLRHGRGIDVEKVRKKIIEKGH